MSLSEHITELRRRVIISVIAVVAATAVAFVFRREVLHFLTRPYCEQHVAHELSATGKCTLVVNGVLDPFALSLKIAFNVGILAASPVWLTQLWRFITPGLRRKERTYVVSFVASSILLFAAGAAVAYLTLPKGLHFLLGFTSGALTPLITATKYISFLLAMVLVFGIAFEFPLLIVMLNVAGMVSAKKLRAMRRLEIFLVFVFAAVATPSQDPFTMTALAVPMCLLYEVAIIIARFTDRRRGVGSGEPDYDKLDDSQASIITPAASI